jgi:hypothetical protein
MGTERAHEIHVTIDGSATLKAQINSSTLELPVSHEETTNFASGGMMERRSTLRDLTFSIDLTDPEVDESVAVSLTKILYDGSTFSSGDDIYTIVAQKVSSGGTGGTPTPKDPTYTFAAVLTTPIPIFVSDVSSLVNKGVTIGFANATAATFAKATS